MPTSPFAPSGSRTPKSCARRRRPHTRCSRGTETCPTSASCSPRARRALERGHDPALDELAAQVADLGYRAADLAHSLAGYLADLDETGPHELAAVEDRRAVLGGLIRAHGSLDAAIELLESGSARLAELDDDGARIERLTH